jgi:hypothetical protein
MPILKRSRNIAAKKLKLDDQQHKSPCPCDLCVVPTLTFDRLFAFLVLGHGRRQLVRFEVTRHPAAEWLARQITEAFPWAPAPAYLVRDNDGAYGHVSRAE